MVGHVLFHLAFPITDLEEAKRFYVDGLGCELGRSSASAMILNLKGHQLVGHLTTHAGGAPKSIYPRHFGLVFTAEEDWQAMADRARAKGLRFYQQSRRRYPGTRLEHATFFLEDPFHTSLSSSTTNTSRQSSARKTYRKSAMWTPASKFLTLLPSL